MGNEVERYYFLIEANWCAHDGRDRIARLYGGAGLAACYLCSQIFFQKKIGKYLQIQITPVSLSYQRGLTRRVKQINYMEYMVSDCPDFPGTDRRVVTFADGTNVLVQPAWLTPDERIAAKTENEGGIPLSEKGAILLRVNAEATRKVAEVELSNAQEALKTPLSAASREHFSDAVLLKKGELDRCAVSENARPGDWLTYDRYGPFINGVRAV